MKIDKKLIKELKDYLEEFNLSEIEYQDGDRKIKVARNKIAVLLIYFFITWFGLNSFIFFMLVV